MNYSLLSGKLCSFILLLVVVFVGASSEEDGDGDPNGGAANTKDQEY